MATRSASRHRSIPVNVVIERRPRTPRPAGPKPPSPPPPTAPVRSRTTAWSDEHRRRIMWISVGVGSLAVIIGWASVFSAQVRGNSPTFFGDVSRMVRDIKWPWEKAPVPPDEQEIRSLEKQVFPQFQ